MAACDLNRPQHLRLLRVEGPTPLADKPPVPPAVVYKGPWKAVIDDDGHKLLRGQRMAVCDKTFQIYGREPYADQIELIAPHDTIPLDDATPYDCKLGAIRSPRETKGATAPLTVLPDDDCCGPSECC